MPARGLLMSAETATFEIVPSPVGHALAGLAVAWTAERIGGVRRAANWPAGIRQRLKSALWGLPAACAILAFLPDLDILFGSHRGPSHSVGGAVIIATLAAGVAVLLRLPVVRTSAACGISVASHGLLDWLGRDTSIPLGIQALWPITSRYFYSGLDIFWDISRRYWLPREFVLGNLIALAHELVYLAPLAAVAFFFRFASAMHKRG
jgi:membrane-bound metal-dependent hydrolase YbcI (DUF457 family)